MSNHLDKLTDGEPTIRVLENANKFVEWKVFFSKFIEEGFIDLNKKLSVNGISANCFKEQNNQINCQYEFSSNLPREIYWNTSLRNLMVIEEEIGNLVSIGDRPRKYWKTSFAINEHVGGFDIDKTVLMNAIQRHNAEVAKELLKKSSLAQINAKTPFGRTALHYAIQSENLELVKLLLKAEANINISGEIIPLQEAAVKSLESIKLLTSKGAEINLINRYGETALMFAASAGKTESVTWLLENRADKNLIDVFGESALDKAQKNKHYEIVKILSQNLQNG